MAIYISSHPVHLAAVDQHMSQYPQYEKPVGSSVGQSALFEQRKRSSLGTAMHVLMLFSVFVIIWTQALHLFEIEISLYRKLFALLLIIVSITLSILLAMGFRLNVAQWTYRCCGTIILSTLVSMDILALTDLISTTEKLTVWRLLPIASYLIFSHLFMIPIAVPLLLPMRSKTLCFLRPISIVMDKASPRV